MLNPLFDSLVPAVIDLMLITLSILLNVVAMIVRFLLIVIFVSLGSLLFLVIFRSIELWMRRRKLRMFELQDQSFARINALEEAKAVFETWWENTGREIINKDTSEQPNDGVPSDAYLLLQRYAIGQMTLSFAGSADAQIERTNFHRNIEKQLAVYGYDKFMLRQAFVR